MRHSYICAISAAYLFATATSKVSLARLPSLSSAVTVMFAVPSATPVTVRAEPPEATDTVAIASSDDAAAMASVPPSASLNTPERETSWVASTSRPLTSPMAEATTGAAFTVRVKVSDTVPPLPSSAVTVIVAVPRAFAVAVSVE